MSKNAHEIIEKIKSDYIDAYRERYGEAAASLLKISYRKGWWYLNASPLSTPYRAKEMLAMTKNLKRARHLGPAQ